jgi:hypothetical protein
MKILLSFCLLFIFLTPVQSQETAVADSAIHEFTVTYYPRTEGCTGLDYTRFKVKLSDYKVPVTCLYISNRDLMYVKSDEKSNYLVRVRIGFRETEIKGCYDSIRKEWLFIAVPGSAAPFISRIENILFQQLALLHSSVIQSDT